jgi:hypothetical protein
MSRSRKTTSAHPGKYQESGSIRRAAVLHLLLAAILLFAASNPQSNIARAASAFQQRPDTIVRVATAPRHKGVGKLVEEVSIGNESGPDPYIFGRVSYVGVGPDSSVYIFDGTATELRKFDAHGKFVRALGRKGQGPGEYERAAGLMVARDGRVFLRVPGSDRINVYSKAGEILESWSNGGSRLFTGDAIQVDANGIVYTKAAIKSGPLAGNETGYIRMGAGGTIIDTLPPPRFAYKPEQIQGITGMSMRSVDGRVDTTLSRGGVNLPFAPAPMWALSPLGYYVTGVPDRYAFELRIPRPSDAGRATSSSNAQSITPVWSEDQTVISIRVPNAEQIKIGAEERELRRRLTEDAMRASDPRWQWSGPPVPQVKPYYKRLETGLDGRIIVALHTAGERYMPAPPPVNPAGPPQPSAARPAYREPAVFDIFEPSGVYVGRMAVPYRHSVFAWWGDRAWGTVTDDDGVQTVKRWRIMW